MDWTPIRYLNKGFSQTVLAGLYRTAQVGVVTPLHDGMNLVAKEYVAAQNPADPGVLVLSKFAGAANELDTALLVNPHDIDGMARTIAIALSMPLTERRMRWEAMMAKLRATPSSNGLPISSTRCRRPSSTRWRRSRRWRSRRPCGRFARSIPACGITERASSASVWPSSGALVAIRHAIENGTARLVRRARIVQRHHALALADEYALSDDAPTICCR